MRGNIKLPSMTKIYVVTFQLSALIMLPYMLFATDLSGAGTSSVVSFLYDLGASALPRGEMLLLSTLYRVTRNEIVLYFALALIAFVFGLAAGKCLKSDKSAKIFRFVCASLIICDLAVRLLPLRFNSVFGTVPAIVGALIRLACLALVAKDLISDFKKTS
ncbi:MAG: hypothetical protein IKN38_10400 [Clostridia bacterium]|nr:hypothetical protein [Clostridia bacterium]